MSRLKALIKKEFKQMLRDKSSMLLGIVMPLILIIIFGYGLSLDIKNSPVAVVKNGLSKDSQEIVSALGASSYFTLYHVQNLNQAKKLLMEGKVDAIVNISTDFSKDKQLQVIINGTDANYGRAVLAYIHGCLSNVSNSEQFVDISIRTWFNDGLESSYSLVTGLIVLIMTLTGSFLTALVMAKEWERGTMESMFVTPVKIREIIAGKIVPYLCLGFVGFIMCLMAAKFLFNIPFVGSVYLMIIIGIMYLLVSLALGLVISSTVKNQFLASQMVLLTTFLPSLMMSGFLFDLTSAPAVVRIIALFLPARWFVEALQTVLLAGNIFSIIAKDFLIMVVLFIVMMRRAISVTRKSLD